MRAKPIEPRYGRLAVLHPLPNDHNRRRRVLVRCDCGTEKNVAVGDLRSGRLLSCGCLRRELEGTHNVTHRLTGTKVYSAWSHAISRCTRPKTQSYANYGGRGIDIDPRWVASFDAFLADMGLPPSPKHTLERKNNDRGYWPDNCRWATRAEQNRNRRANVWVALCGRHMVLVDAVARLGIHLDTVRWRMVNHGLTHQQAIDHYARAKGFA